MWTWSAAELDALAAFLAARGLGAGGPVRTQPIGGGLANLTFRVRDAAHLDIVVRRPPPPPIPPGANDVVREARVMAALRAGAAAVPVPAVLAVGTPGEVFADGVPFAVLSYVEGEVVTEAVPPALHGEEEGMGHALVDVLAALHAVDPVAVGLGDLGRPEGFNARQATRLGRLIADPDGALPDAFAPLQRWLVDHAPPEAGAAIVHGDFRLGNVMLAPTAPARIAAVLDWEMATLGDPLHDLGWLLASWPQRGAPTTPMQDLGTAVLAAGFPDRAGLADRYATLSGRDLTHLPWYVAMATYKMAVLFEHSHRRAVAGTGDPHYADARLVPRFLAAVGCPR